MVPAAFVAVGDALWQALHGNLPQRRFGIWRDRNVARGSHVRASLQSAVGVLRRWQLTSVPPGSRFSVPCPLCHFSHSPQPRRRACGPELYPLLSSRSELRQSGTSCTQDTSLAPLPGCCRRRDQTQSLHSICTAGTAILATCRLGYSAFFRNLLTSRPRGRIPGVAGGRESGGNCSR